MKNLMNYIFLRNLPSFNAEIRLKNLFLGREHLKAFIIHYELERASQMQRNSQFGKHSLNLTVR